MQNLRSIASEPKICLYCDASAGSLEHVLASGIGGRLTKRGLVCEVHNNLCGRYADAPLCEQFATIVNALEVLQGDGTRGTSVALVSQSGTRFTLSADFRFSMRAKVDRSDDGAFEVTATPNADIGRIEKQISATAEFAASRSEVQRHDFVSPFASSGPGNRGVLKAALHFVAMLTTERASIRRMCLEVAPAIFSDQLPSAVSMGFYDAGDRGRDVHRHEITAWNEDGVTLVVVKLFNVTNYLVRLPFVPIEPTRYVQDVRTGRKSVNRVDIPIHQVDVSLSTPEGMQSEFARRLDEIVLVASTKSDIVDILDAAVATFSYRSAIGADAREAVLKGALREAYEFRDGHYTTWSLREIVDFGERMARLFASSVRS